MQRASLLHTVSGRRGVHGNDVFPVDSGTRGQQRRALWRYLAPKVVIGTFPLVPRRNLADAHLPSRSAMPHRSGLPRFRRTNRRTNSRIPFVFNPAERSAKPLFGGSIPPRASNNLRGSFRKDHLSRYHGDSPEFDQSHPQSCSITLIHAR